jgi:hypothetical protein
MGTAMSVLSRQNPAAFAAFIWRSLPKLAGWWPTGSKMLRDGDYLLAWPNAAASVWLAAFGLGALLGALHLGSLFTGSLFTVMLLVAVGSFGGGLGFATWVGFVASDTALHRLGEYHPVPALFPLGVVLVDGLLFAGCVQLAPLSTWLRAGIVRFVPRGGLRVAAGCIVQATFQGYLARTWTLVLPVLIRPYAEWQRDELAASDVAPMQTHGLTIVAVAAVAGGVRVVLEHYAANAVRPARPVAASPGSGGIGARWLHAILRAVTVTFFLSGAIDSSTEALFVVAAIVALFVLSTLIQRSAGWINALLMRVPLAVRLGAVVVIAYPICSTLYPTIVALQQELPAQFGQPGTSYLPLIVSTLATLVLMTLLVPEQWSHTSKASA